MIYQFKPYTELMKNEKQTIEFLNLFIKKTVDEWNWVYKYQDEFRDLYAEFKKNNSNCRDYNDPIDDHYFIASLAFYDESDNFESVHYLLGYENQSHITEYAIICKIKNEFKNTFEKVVSDIDCYYLADNTLQDSIIPEVIKQIQQMSNNPFCLYVDVYNHHKYELALLKKLKFKEVKFHSKNYEQIHKDYKIDLNKFTRFKLIISQQED